ncbi:hypothetical protein AX16_008917 [Volvariella volvacea WC 439]|nr:hypothetical protein AX16_008917 [Volvariella volvacea WC 439]
MLLRFSNPDMLSSSLIDVATGVRAYDIATVRQDCLSSPESSLSMPPITSSSASSSLPEKDPRPLPPSDAERHTTIISDALGIVRARITWIGRQPDITIGDNHIGGLSRLFGSSTVRFMPKVLAIPTRFDAEYVWTATANSLTLFDYKTEQTKGTFHHNAIRLPSATKPSLRSQEKSSSSTLVHTHLPGVGSNYLEFSPHPLADPVEIIISFMMMEILRRGRFNLTPYEFQRPKLWRLNTKNGHSNPSSFAFVPYPL